MKNTENIIEIETEIETETEAEVIKKENVRERRDGQEFYLLLLSLFLLSLLYRLLLND